MLSPLIKLLFVGADQAPFHCHFEEPNEARTMPNTVMTATAVPHPFSLSETELRH
jgi:hypothetical protein